MAAIAAELAPDVLSLTDEFADDPSPRGINQDAPDIEIGHGQAGRETLAAIAHELLSDISDEATGLDAESSPRVHRHTVSYEDRPLTPPAAPVRRARTATLDYTERPATTERSAHVTGTTATRDVAAPDRQTDEFEIHEMVTFVVRGELAGLSSTSGRRDFVRDHLMHRLPVERIDQVDRIDVTPWTVRGTVIVRVWCRL